MSFRLNWKNHIKIYIIALIISFILKEQVEIMVLKSAIDIYEATGVYFSLLYLILVFLYLAAVMVPITLLHEGLHSLVHLSFGGKVKIGFKGIYAYCQELSGIELTRTQFLVVLLTPVTVISIISIFLPYKWGLIIFILNLLGSSGDLFMALWLCRLKGNSRIIDRSYGFDVKM